MASGTGNAYLQSRPRPDDSQLGSLIRMHALKSSELPSHPDLASTQTASTQPPITQFVGDALAEAEYFITKFLSSSFKIKSGNKQSAPSTAHIEVLSHQIKAAIPPGQGGGGGASLTEAWFARTSIHENAAKDGTASWEEFDGGLRHEHSVNEGEYTPDIRDAHLVLDWGSQLADHQRTIGEWRDVHMEIRQMVHHLPPPLAERCFTTLVITARKETEFLVVQIPVESGDIPSAKYSSTSKITEGIYVSIERGELIEGGEKVKWQMGTASDARGSLPMWVQKMAMPDAVAKDVGLFIDWCSQRRAGKV